MTGVQLGGRSFMYKGTLYSGSGKYLLPESDGMLLSSDGKWLAVQSFDADFKASAPWTPSRGVSYIDVFDTTSGKRVFGITFSFSGIHTDELGGETGWLGSYLLVDYFNTRQGFSLCRPRSH